MKDMSRQMVIGSAIVAVLVALSAILDLTMGIPYSGSAHTRLMDILFLVASAIVGYLCWDALKDLS